MRKIKKKKHVSLFSYVFIAVLVAGITVGVIVVQEGSHIFSYAKSSFGVPQEPIDDPLGSFQTTPPVTTSGACGWCGTSCLPREQLKRLRCAQVDTNPGFSCMPVSDNGQTVCTVVPASDASN